MPADVKLDSINSEVVVIEGAVLRAETADLMLDHPQRRRPGGGPYRRALVHDQRDGLTVNFNGDYPAGVRIINASINLNVLYQSGGDPQLPKAGTIGDLLMIVNRGLFNGQPVGISCSLWLCVPTEMATLGATWQRIPLGETVRGTV
jgi:hypothetical protein